MDTSNDTPGEFQFPNPQSEELGFSLEIPMREGLVFGSGRVGQGLSLEVCNNSEVVVPSAQAVVTSNASTGTTERGNPRPASNSMHPRPHRPTVRIQSLF